MDSGPWKLRRFPRQRPAGHRSHWIAQGTPVAFELTVEIRSMPKSLIESRHRTAGALSGHALVAWLGAVSTFRSRSPHAGSESRLYHFDSAIFADFA